jgi:hypothetical protein
MTERNWDTRESVYIFEKQDNNNIQKLKEEQTTWSMSTSRILRARTTREGTGHEISCKRWWQEKWKWERRGSTSFSRPFSFHLIPFPIPFNLEIYHFLFPLSYGISLYFYHPSCLVSLSLVMDSSFIIKEDAPHKWCVYGCLKSKKGKLVKDTFMLIPSNSEAP